MKSISTLRAPAITSTAMWTAPLPTGCRLPATYVRQGRIDLDGYQLYQASQGLTTVLDGMFTASEVFDTRRPTPVVAQRRGLTAGL